MTEKLPDSDPWYVEPEHIEPAPGVSPAHLEPPPIEAEPNFVCTDRDGRFDVGDAVHVRFRVVDVVPIDTLEGELIVDYRLRLES